MQEIVRFNDTTEQLVTFQSNPAAITDGFNMAQFAGGLLFVTAASGQNLDWYAKRKHTDTQWYRLKSNGNYVQSLNVQTNDAIPVPEEAFAAAMVAAVTSSGTVSCYGNVKG